MGFPQAVASDKLPHCLYEGRFSVCGDGAEFFPLPDCHDPVSSPAQSVCLLQYRVEYWREVTEGRIDNLQHLGDGRPLRQRLVTLGCALGKLTFKFGNPLLGIG